MEKDEEKLMSRRRLEKWAKIFLVFLGFAWLCTIISKSIYVSGLTIVKADTPSKKYVEHVVETDGIVTTGGEIAVNTLSGIRVDRLYVMQGDEVKAGDVLFTLDTKDIGEIISTKEAELAKLQCNLADIQFNAVIDAQKKEVAILWAQEDYETADKETAIEKQRAKEALDKATAELEAHLANTVPYTSDSARGEAWNDYHDWVNKGYGLSDQITAKQREIKDLEEQLAGLGQGSSAGADAHDNGQTGEKTLSGAAGDGEAGDGQEMNHGEERNISSENVAGNHFNMDNMDNKEGSKGNTDNEHSADSNAGTGENNSENSAGADDKNIQDNSAGTDSKGDQDNSTEIDNKGDQDNSAGTDSKGDQDNSTEIDNKGDQDNSAGTDDKVDQDNSAGTDDKVDQDNSAGTDNKGDQEDSTGTDNKDDQGNNNGTGGNAEENKGTGDVGDASGDNQTDQIASDENSAARTELQNQIKKANEELLALQDELTRHNRNVVQPPDYSKEEIEFDEWQNTRSVLEANVQKAKEHYNDVSYSREVTLRQKLRDIASVQVTTRADSTAAIYELDIKQIQTQLAGLYSLQRQKGEVRAENDGMISDIQREEGGRTADMAAMLMTDTQRPCQFKFSITKEQGKYVHLNDTVNLELNGQSTNMEVTVDYFTENMQGGYDLACMLPEGVGKPGLSGTAQKSVQGEYHNLTLPVDAVHEESGSYFIYTLNEKEGILGSEYYAEKIKVQIKDKNDRFVALESGTISADTKVITYATKELKQGESVRPQDK